MQEPVRCHYQSKREFTECTHVGNQECRNEFTKDVKAVDFTKIPLLDRESSEKLGDRKMGQATEWVSQFYVSDEYTQINYNDMFMRFMKNMLKKY